MGGVCGNHHHQHQHNQFAKSPIGPHRTGCSFMNPERMKFNIIFENLRLQYPTKSCHLSIKLAGEILMETPNHIDLDGKHAWKKIVETQIQANILELHEKKLEFYLLEEKNVIATLEIPIFDIISGPIHFDYSIGKGRLSFDMQMAQILQIDINPIEIDCSYVESIKDKAYVFNLRLVTRKMYFTSPNSESFYNPAYLRGFNSSLNNFLQEMMFRTTWNSSSELPIFSIELPSNEMYNSSLQVCIWSINKGNEFQSPGICSIKSLKEKCEKEVFIDQNLFAETFIALHKLIQEDDEEDFQMYQQFKTTVTKSLWCKGNKVGTIQCKFNVKLPRFLKQKLVGIRTENGCTLGVNICSSKSVAQIAEITNIFQKLYESMFKMQSLSHNDPNRTILQHQALTISQQLLIEVQKADKDTNSKLFYYKHQEDLFKAQEYFIKIAEQITKYIDKLDENLREVCYEILLVIIDRGEFRLHSLGYFEECKQLSKKQLELKNTVNLHYSEFMLQTLNWVLLKVPIKTSQQNERKFMMRFLVLSFIRIYNFKDQLLKCINKPNDPQLVEWRGNEFQLEEQDVFINEQVAMIFDWQTYFYNYVTQNQQYQLSQSMYDEQWKLTLGKRSLIYQYFIMDYCTYIQQILQKNNIQWQHVPGYKQLLKSFLSELKLKESYTASFFDCVMAISRNTNIINIIVMILFNKTNLYQSDQVIQVFDLLSLIINQCPQTLTVFDYPFFLNGIRIVLAQSEHAIAIATVLELIYTNFLKFPIEFRKAIIDLLFEPICFELFLHWSKTVRTVFMSFLLYRICHQYRNNKISVMDEELFEQQYLIASKPRKNFSFYENRKEEKQLIADYIYLKYTRFMMNIEQVKIQLKQFPIHKDLQVLQNLKEKLAQKNQYHQENQNIIIQEQRQDDKEEIPSEKQIIFERRNEYRNPTKKRTIILSDNKYKYLKVALNEFSELTKQYTRWRYQSMNMSGEELSPEEKGQAYLNFQVPQIKILVHYDQKEGRQD
ncbi:unnamed protein product [Paramecium primaurelia]|uniref:Uncharacterized protein n=1 Tax=Paramecium primaurelia TaxID=5886 RepID=A0A8S1LHU8_PARPR|nr:unnamed protein product [Paramecium primaurelia]